MRVIAIRRLRDFWSKPGRADSEQPLRAWHREAKRASWAGPEDIKATYRNASVLPDSRVVFNIAGNKYRLIVKINYAYRVVYIRFTGTHAEYDRVDATTI